MVMCNITINATMIKNMWIFLNSVMLTIYKINMSYFNVLFYYEEKKCASYFTKPRLLHICLHFAKKKKQKKISKTRILVISFNCVSSLN